MKISVVIIAKNAESTISRCLDSLTNQYKLPEEIIVVDGNSGDRTREIASKYSCKIIVSEGNDTYGSARNLGVTKASGDIIAFIDADDYADQNWLHEIACAFEDPSIKIATVKRDYRYPTNWFTELKWGVKRQKPAATNPSQKRAVKWDDFRTISGVVRRSEIESVGGFDPDMFFGTEDKDLAFRIWRGGNQVFFIPKAVVYHRPASTVREWMEDMFYRHGIGHGIMRRRYGVYRPPILTPMATLIALSTVVFLIDNRLWMLMLDASAAAVILLAVRAFRRHYKSGRLLHSITYCSLEVLARNLELAGFAIGYLVSAKTLRRIWRR